MRFSRHAFFQLAHLLLVLSVTVLDNIALRLGKFPLTVGMMMVYVYLALLVLGGRIQLSIRRLVLYGGSAVVAGLSILVNDMGTRQELSVSSLALVLVLYFPHLFLLKRGTLEPSERDLAQAIRIFGNVTLFCAVAGIAQFYGQKFIRERWLFDYVSLLPEYLRGNLEYNTVIPVGKLFKSNGFFFREPSLFSGMMGLAILVEFHSRRRWARLAFYGMGLLVAYSGTGIVVLVFGVIFPLRLSLLSRLFAVAAAGSIAYMLLAEPLQLTFLVDRLGEFRSERSSAYHRYVAPARLIGETLFDKPWTALVGHGPGTIDEAQVRYAYHDPTWAKITYEYGLLGFLAFVSLYASVTHRRLNSPSVSGALLGSWLVTGGLFLSPNTNYVALALVGVMPALARTRRSEPVVADDTLSADDVAAVPGHPAIFAHVHGSAHGMRAAESARVMVSAVASIEERPVQGRATQVGRRRSGQDGEATVRPRKDASGLAKTTLLQIGRRLGITPK